MNELSDALRRQMALNETKNLLHAESRWLLQIDPMFLAAVETLLAGEAAGPSLPGIEELASEAAARLIDRAQSINQFVQVDVEARQALVRIYLESWQRLLEGRDIEPTLRHHHYPRIASWLEDRYPTELRGGLRHALILGTVPCSEYSAELQLRLFRLDVASLRQPLLDAGCGAHAHLTAYLRSRGIEAYGFDRRLEVHTEYLREADWFDLPLGRSRWGTVTANLSFTNHLRFAQRYEPRSLPRYRERYHDILDSLAPEGSFVYAPAARILEEGVDRNRFAVEDWVTPTGHQVARVTKIPNQRLTLRARANPEP